MNALSPDEFKLRDPATRRPRRAPDSGEPGVSLDPEGEAAAAEAADPPPASPPEADPNPRTEGGEPAQSPDFDTAVRPGVPTHLAQIEVTLSVEIGAHRIALRDLLAVEPGQLFQLDRLTAEPVTVLANGRPFARGEVVAIGDRFGVRLIDIICPES
jgi:flagellar motor switch protein FliN/FliY